ncbi:hypothetical protein ZHAS_00019338 [Anopheles sinensis]|uniref:Uncharacterized protein n=1 Tax=Anopheles sinensis TaxID=74873 RepID=A0A084WLQ5_ANOSI|nr:hypothetical protein ZHAS_00019338 [Anopheles sinensis]
MIARKKAAYGAVSSCASIHQRTPAVPRTCANGIAGGSGKYDSTGASVRAGNGCSCSSTSTRTHRGRSRHYRCDYDEAFSPAYGGVPVASAVLLLENACPRSTSSTTGCYPFDLFQRGCPAQKLSHAIPCYAGSTALRGKLTFPLATEWLV